MTRNDGITLRAVLTPTLRESQRSITVTLTDAVRAAGLEDADALDFAAAGLDVPEDLVVATRASDPSAESARSLRKMGNRFEVVLPPEQLARLGLTAEDAPETDVQVYASDDPALIAIGRPAEVHLDYADE